MPPVFAGPRVAIAGLVLLGLACSLLPAALPTATPAPTATLTPTPSSSPTPSPTPSSSEQVTAARQALTNGDWELAFSEFSRVIEQGLDAPTAVEALYGRGESLLRIGLHSEAQLALTELIDRSPDYERVAQARLLRAQASLALSQPEQAISDYLAYLEARPGILDTYVEEWLGDALRQAARPLEATGRYQAAIASPRIADATPLRIKIGRSYLEGGDFNQALAQFDGVYALTTDASTRASMNLLAADALQGLGDLDGMYGRYLDSVSNYPTAYDSYVGLVRLVNAGVPVDDFQRGLVDYHAGAYEPALAAFDRVLAVLPSAAGFYYRGLTQLALGNSLQALADFDSVVSAYPADPLWTDAMSAKARTEWAYLDQYSAAVDTYLALGSARPEPGTGPEALFAAGRTAERAADLRRAADIWLTLAQDYPGTTLAFDGAFQAGVALFRLGAFAEASTAFGLALEQATTSSGIAAAHLWVGKCAMAAGDRQAAEQAWGQAAAADPTGYYSVRAAGLLRDQQPFESSEAFDFTTEAEAERREAEDWLRGTFDTLGPDPLSELDPSLAADQRLIRGRELWAIGELELANAELSALRLSVESDAEQTYRLMHELLRLGVYREAIFAARQILRLAGLDDAATLSAPVYFNRIRFGPYFGELILPEAARYDFDGLFLLSVVRQESLFESFATSSAEAHGLMQVIPSTGESIAAQLGWPPDYTAADLNRPIVSVRFGTFYLAAQRDRFEGDLYAALAAYNAGPGNALIWKELAPTDPDLFLEVIRLEQPHRYIQVIYEVYEIYRQLYAGG